MARSYDQARLTFARIADATLDLSLATLTTSSIADPDLVLEDRWLKVFTAFYILLGIGILVEVVRRFGMAFIEVRRQEKSQGDEARTGA